jgi:hypothetical protein
MTHTFPDSLCRNLTDFLLTYNNFFNQMNNKTALTIIANHLDDELFEWNEENFRRHYEMFHSSEPYRYLESIDGRRFVLPAKCACSIEGKNNFIIIRVNNNRWNEQYVYKKKDVNIEVLCSWWWHCCIWTKWKSIEIEICCFGVIG